MLFVVRYICISLDVFKNASKGFPSTDTLNMHQCPYVVFGIAGYFSVSSICKHRFFWLSIPHVTFQFISLVK